MHALLSGIRSGGGAGSFVSGALGLWVFSAAVCAMSTPDDKSSKGYQWLYRFSHLVAANLDRVGLTGAAEASAASETQHN
jgi:hypothetical protein